jgi:hypothetical protein
MVSTKRDQKQAGGPANNRNFLRPTRFGPIECIMSSIGKLPGRSTSSPPPPSAQNGPLESSVGEASRGGSSGRPSSGPQAVVTSDEVNFLVYRYLQESGMHFYVGFYIGGYVTPILSFVVGDFCNGFLHRNTQRGASSFFKRPLMSSF